MYGTSAAPRTSQSRLDSLRHASRDASERQWASVYTVACEEREEWEREAERAACLAYELHVALRCMEETHDAARHDLREEDGR